MKNVIISRAGSYIVFEKSGDSLLQTPVSYFPTTQKYVSDQLTITPPRNGESIIETSYTDPEI